MFARLNHSRLLRYAGLFTWLMVGWPLATLWLEPVPDGLDLGDALGAPARVGWQAWLAYFLFGRACGVVEGKDGIQLVLAHVADGDRHS